MSDGELEAGVGEQETPRQKKDKFPEVKLTRVPSLTEVPSISVGKNLIAT